MIGIQLAPVDTWFFRDGTPFSAGDSPQSDIGSLFPPHPGTVVGALRAALALSHGWNGRGRWSQDICGVLGDGPEDLGRLSIDAPILLRDGDPLFRVPRHLVGTAADERWNPVTYLRPGPPVNCDLGEAVRLPEIVDTVDDPSDLEQADDFWLTVGGLNAVLRGELPETSELVSSAELWSVEFRIGLELDRATRTAREGLLYSTQHVRPRPGVSLGARIDGLPPDWDAPSGRLITLGGEGRMADCREWDGHLAIETPGKEVTSDGRFALIALTPLDIDEDVYVGRQPLEVLGGALIVSACLDRPQRVGGWNSLVRRPLPQRSVLPAGSVLYCERPESAQSERTMTADGGLIRLGNRTRFGFGLAVASVWPERNKGG